MVRFVIGTVALIVAAGSSLVLVLQHLFGMTLPGCGEGSPCAAAAASVWGKVPGLGWPTSFVGLAYFLAMLVAWLWTRGAPRAVLSGVAIVGGLGSVALTVVMIAGGYVCQYCLAVHLANLVFVGLVLHAALTAKAEPAGSTTGAATATSGAVPFAIAVVMATGALFVTERVVSSAVEAQAEHELAETERQLAERVEEPEPFTGRYLLGPENAPIRMVVISDFQCPDCLLVEQQIRDVFAGRTDMSISAKHFPMSTVCNKYMERDLHPNACWAARAAEAAGILRGNDGFWEMHHWLFDRQPVPGAFTDAELHTRLIETGYNVREFLDVMQSEETLRRVQDDIDEAYNLGLYYTPMVFINGVELKGWRASNAVRRAVEAVAATDPQPAPPTADQPPDASERFMADWLEQPQRRLSQAPLSWPLGPADAKVRIIMWGELQEENCARADALIREYLNTYDDVSYEFRPYPWDQSCNAQVRSTLFPHGCAAAKMALAAGQIGGSDAYWAMHTWLMEHQVPLDDAAVAQAAAATELDEAALRSAMESPEVSNAIAQDARVAKSAGVRALPFIFVNERWLPRWTRDDEPRFIERVFAEARAGSE